MADEEGWTPLHHAAHYGHLAVLRVLLTHPGANVHARGRQGMMRPLDAAGSAGVARALLDAGACATAPPGALSPLHHAVYHSRDDVVALLLSRGARASDAFSAQAVRVMFGDNFPGGGTALHMAAVALNAARGCVQLRGGTVMAPLLAPELARAHDCAQRRAAIVTHLINAGADVDALSSAAPAAAGGARSLWDAASCLMNSQTPLMLAAQAGDAAVIRALLAGGARVGGVHSQLGHTALHFAALGGHVDAIHALVAAGAHVNPAGAAGREEATPSPLLYAMAGNHTRAVRALLELGADSAAAEVVLRSTAAAVIGEATRELVARHRAGGGPAPARVCALPSCEARRRADYDDKKLMKCAACGRVVYCCKEHQRAHWRHHKALCKAVAAAKSAADT